MLPVNPAHLTTKNMGMHLVEMLGYLLGQTLVTSPHFTTQAGQIEAARPCTWSLPPAQQLFSLETKRKEVKAEREKQMFPKI